MATIMDMFVTLCHRELSPAIKDSTFVSEAAGNIEAAHCMFLYCVDTLPLIDERNMVRF